MNGLATYFLNRQEKFLNENLFEEILVDFLEGKKVSQTQLLSIVDRFLAIEIKTFQDLTEYYQKLLPLFFITSLSELSLEGKEKELLKKGKLAGFGPSYTLHAAYQLLVSHLANIDEESTPIKSLEKGGMLQESGFHDLTKHFPSPLENAHLALIFLYLGWKKNDEDLFLKGLKLTEFCLTLCDKEGKIFQGIWVREADYNLQLLEEAFVLLFSVTAILFENPKVKLITEKGTYSLFIALFAFAFQDLKERGIPFPRIAHKLTVADIDQSLAYFKYHYGDLSAVYVGSGVNTGLGALHKNGIKVVSFGPHHSPLADSNCFGIFRPSNGSREGFKDVQIELEEDRGRCKGWVRVISPMVHNPFPGEEWLYFDAKMMKETFDLEIRLNVTNENSPIAFVFFVSAETARVDQKEPLLPGTLDRIKGECQEIMLERKNEKLCITPLFDGEMEVIPLAGKNHFWSADFLIAFPIKESLKPYRWSIH